MEPQGYKRMTSSTIFANITKKAKTFLKMVVDGKQLQIMKEDSDTWVDFDGEDHGSLIYSDSDYRYRVKPVDKFYYNAVFSNGSRTDIFDSIDKVELVADGMDGDDFVVERLIVDLSFSYDK